MKGHSDDTKQWHQLSRNEQINVLCDESATAELTQQKQSEDRPVFHPLPQTKCYLRHRGRFVTSHEDKILLWSLPEDQFMSYLSTKYGWSRQTRLLINWPAFTAAKSQPHLRFFVPKLLIRWLPTLSVLSKREPIAPECPLCHLLETNDHIFVCEFRLPWHIKLKHKMNSHLLENKTCPVIQKEMTTGLLNSLNLAQSDLCGPPSTALLTQEKIGWTNLLRGLVSKKWQNQQNIYATLFLSPKEQERNHRWSHKLTKFLLSFAHELWIARCDSIHHNVARFETEQQRRRANVAVTAVYQHRHNISVSDQEQFFKIPLEEKLKESASSLITWHATIKKALKRAVKDYGDELVAQHKPISEFFQKARKQRNIPQRKSKRRTTQSMATTPAFPDSHRRYITPQQKRKQKPRTIHSDDHTVSDHSSNHKRKPSIINSDDQTESDNNNPT